jgi:hypothetical protein
MTCINALSTLFPKKKRNPSIEDGDVSSYQTDVFNGLLLIFMTAILTIILANLMRTWIKQRQSYSTNEDNILTLITKIVKLNVGRLPLNNTCRFEALFYGSSRGQTLLTEINYAFIWPFLLGLSIHMCGN